MKFAININGQESMIDVSRWESTVDNRIEFYAVFADHQETFINFVKRTDQLVIAEVSSSADLTQDHKKAIKERLLYFIQQHAHDF